MRPAGRRGYLGVGVMELTDERVKALNLKDDQGLEVRRVNPDSPAAKAGLKESDVILELNGKPVDDIQQFIRTVSETEPGSKVNLTIWRNGARQNVTATIEARPENAWMADPGMPMMPPQPQFPPFEAFPIPGSARVGFEGESVSGQLADYFGVHQGVLVRSVVAGTPAERAGLKAGDVVVKVNGTPVTNPREISAMVRMSRKKNVSMTVVRNKREMSLSVEVSGDSGITPQRMGALIRDEALENLLKNAADTLGHFTGALGSPDGNIFSAGCGTFSN
jgi:serine protease Do